MPEDLLSDLAAELAADPDTRDLGKSLDQICIKLKEHWAQTHLTWFTDHGVNHAQRVAKRALALGALPNPPPGVELSRLERYILCAASLLHDIGMNDLSWSPRPLGNMLPADYERVRHDHSSQSGSMIISNPGNWGLPADAVLADLVGLVAQAHGTKNYRMTIPLIEERTRIRDEPVRGPLLAALLLMADELDLSYGREVTIPGGIQLNAVSEAHAFKHRCIAAASADTAPNGTASIELRLSIPNDLPYDAKVNIERWVVGKLRRQMALVDPEIVEGFAKSFRFDRAIRVKHVQPLGQRPLPSKQALAVISAEVTIDDLIDHRDKLRRAEAALRDSHVIITGRWGAEARSDSHGREGLYLATIEKFRAEHKSRVACSTRLHNLGGAEASDVLEEWLHSLSAEYDSAVPEDGGEESARAKLLDACIKVIGALSDKLLILGVSCFDRLTDEGMKWLTTTAIPQIAHASSADLRLIMTANKETQVPALEPQVSVIPTEEIDLGEVEEFLSGAGLEDAATLARSGLSYFHLQQICNRKRMTLQAQGSQ